MKLLLLTANLFLVAALITGMAGTAYADNADVLPKGRSRANVSTAYYFPIDTRFDENGNDEDIAAYYNTTLNNYIFPILAGFEESQGGPFPDGTANVGDTIVTFEITGTELSADYQYGLTDKLTVGFSIPYSWYKREVTSEVSTTNANVGKNPGYDPDNADPSDPYDPRWYPVVPFGVPLTENDVIDLLSGGLDVNGDGRPDIEGYGYERFGSWSENGIGDIILGGRYQYFKNDQWRLAFTGGVSMPTGDADNPNDLMDMPFGADTWGLIFQLQNDYIATKDLILNFSLKYHLYLPDTVTLRVPNAVDIPITTNQEEVDRDVGDQFKFNTSATYQFNAGLSGSIEYQYWKRLKDEIDGKLGFAYESLEDLTDKTAHMYLIGISYSTIPLFLEKKFSVPLNVSLTYENVFAGSNNFLKQQDIILSLSVYF